MSKKYNKNFFKELKEKSALHYDSIPALNWGTTEDGKFIMNDRYHFNWKIQGEKGHLVPLQSDVREHIKTFQKTIAEENEKSGIQRSVKAFIGADSQNHLSYTRFVSVIVLYVERNGAHVLVSRTDLPKIYDYRYKLLKEIDMLGELARNFQEFFKEINMEFELHGDLNKSANFKSNGVVEEATNYISYLGYKLKIKSEAWAASYGADYFCK